MNKHRMLKVLNSPSCVCSSKSVFVCFFLPPSVCCLLFFKDFFGTTCEMPTQPGERINNGVHTTRRTRRFWVLFHIFFFYKIRKQSDMPTKFIYIYIYIYIENVVCYIINKERTISLIERIYLN